MAGRQRVNQYRFVDAEPCGNHVQLHYMPWSCNTTWKSQRQEAKHFRITAARWAEIQASSPGPLKQTPFRIVKERDRSVDLEWIT